ncbi:MAG: hypothetical protein VKO39_11835 [Cyanobacteriota bacterium]|nr:hypothetical protein [Cyanobacteriota bacterium]
MGRPVLSLLSLATASLVGWPHAPLEASSGADPTTTGRSAATLLARGGGGGGGRGGGGIRGGGGQARTGFGGGGSFTRGDNRPSGGFSGGDRLNRVGNPSISRPATQPAGGLDRPINRPVGGLNRPSSGPQRPDGGTSLGDRRADLGNQTLNRGGDRTFNREGDRSINLDRGTRSINVERDWNRQVTIGDINVHPGWARPGWGVARPWNWGWYGGWSNPPWGWWGARAAAWGIGTLATAAIINNAVNDAVSNDVSTIVVPNTDYQLLFGTVQPVGEASVSFVVTVNGTNYQLTADCKAGTINARLPNTAQEAELLNAACQVAFGDAS